jgi:hypothetical protein
MGRRQKRKKINVPPTATTADFGHWLNGKIVLYLGVLLQPKEKFNFL